MSISLPSRALNAARQRGLTLLELLIVLALLGILMAIGMPSFSGMLGRASAETAANTLAGAFELARSEAIKRGRLVSVCPSTSGADCSAGSWSAGWIVFIDANGDASGGSGSVDAGDEVLRVYAPLADVVLTGNTNLVRFNSRGFGTDSVLRSFRACPEDGDDTNARGVEIAVTGRVRLVEGGLTCS